MFPAGLSNHEKTILDVYEQAHNLSHLVSEKVVTLCAFTTAVMSLDKQADQYRKERLASLSTTLPELARDIEELGRFITTLKRLTKDKS